MTQVFRAVMGAGLLAGAGTLSLGAQSMALPAADPVGIARSGAQVAYGFSLEAASTNPALLASLKEQSGFHVALGRDMMGLQQSLEANQRTYESLERNRTLAAFGLATRLNSAWTLGLKLDQPYMRHAELATGAPTRFQGTGIDLSTHRLEAQAAWAFSPALSLGFGLGVARLSYGSTSLLRLGVPQDPTLAASATNPLEGLVEQGVGQDGHKVVPSYSLGLRWALSPRWTLGFTHQSGLKGDLALTGSYLGASTGLYGNDGLSSAPIGTATRAAVLLATASPLATTATLQLPSQTTLGMRHRISPMITWEADLRWTSANLRVPALPSVGTPSGTVNAPITLPEGKSHFGLQVSAEVELSKFWLLRGGLALEQRSIEETNIEPLLGGARTSAFSFGAGYRTWGGELSIGYQYRQSEDQDTRKGDGVWSATGYRPTGTRVRLEGMGHLLALGFRKSF
jgi:long-subunit fatty acid transport protein